MDLGVIPIFKHYKGVDFCLSLCVLFTAVYPAPGPGYTVSNYWVKSWEFMGVRELSRKKRRLRSGQGGT